MNVLLKNKKRGNKPLLTELDKKNIKDLLYRGLREGEEIVDNRVVTIAKELKLPKSAVFYYISKL